MKYHLHQSMSRPAGTLLATLLLASGGTAAPLAILTGVSGSVQIVSGGKASSAKSGAKLNAGDKVVSRGGTATIFYLGRAPQKVAVGMTAAVTATAGGQNAGVWKTVYAGMNNGFKARPMAAAAVRNGEVTLWSPFNTKITGKPRFAWTAKDTSRGFVVAVTVVDAGSKEPLTVWKTKVTGTTAEFPAALALVPGQTYTWSLAFADDEDTPLAFATFQVATAAEATSMAAAEKAFAALDAATRRNSLAAYADSTGFSGKALELLVGVSQPAFAAARFAGLDDTGQRLARSIAERTGQTQFLPAAPALGAGPGKTVPGRVAAKPAAAGKPAVVADVVPDAPPVRLAEIALDPTVAGLDAGLDADGGFKTVPASARKTYADPKGAFSVEIPRSWGVTRLEAGNLTFTELSSQYNGPSGITVAVTPKTADLTATIIAIMKGSGEVKPQPTVASVFNGTPARKTVISWQLNGVPYRGSMTEFVRDEQTIVVGVGATEGAKPEIADGVMALVDSLLPTFRTENVTPGKPVDMPFEVMNREMEKEVLPAMQALNTMRQGRMNAREKPANLAAARASWTDLQAKMQAAPAGSLERVEAMLNAANGASDLAWAMWQGADAQAAGGAKPADTDEASALYARAGALRRESYAEEIGVYENAFRETETKLAGMRPQTVPSGSASAYALVINGWEDVQAMRLKHLQTLAMEAHDGTRQLEWAKREAGVRRQQFEEGVLSLDDDRGRYNRRLNFARALEAVGGGLDAQANFVQADSVYARALAWRDALPVSFALRSRDSTLRARGSTALRSGDYLKAREYYQAALTEIEAGAAAQQADADHWNSAEMSALKRADLAQSRAVVLNNLGYVAHGLGDYAAAEKYYRTAYESVESLPNDKFTGWVKSSVQSSALGNVSTVKADAGNTEEALKINEQVGVMLRATADDDGLALWMANRAGMLQLLGQIAAAKQLIQESHRLFVAQNRPDRAALTSGFQARLAREGGDLASAQTFAKQSLEFARASRDGEAIVSATRALAAVRLEQIKAAPVGKDALWREFDALVAEAVAQDTRMNAAMSSVSTLNLRAQGKEQRGDLNGALADYAAAIKKLEATRATTSGDDFTESKANYAVYESIVRLLLKMNRPEDAFDYLSRARSKRLQDSLRLSSIQTKDVKLQSLLDKASGLEKKLGTLRAQLETETARPDAERDAKKVANLNNLVAATQAEFFKVSGDIRAANPNFDSVLTVKPRELKKAQPSIPAGAVLIQYAPFGDKLYIFVVSRDNLKIYAPDVPSKDLLDAVRSFRTQMTAAQSRITAGKALIAPEDDPALKASLTGLYKMLIAPIEGELKGVTTVAFIPSGPLYYLPLHALAKETPQGLHYVIEDVRVAYLAAADVLAVVQARDESRMGTGMLALGDPTGAGLPAARAEVREISKIFPAGQALVGADATKGVLQDAKNLDRRVLHLATHGILNSVRPDSSYIQLAGAGDLAHLTVGEVYGLDLNHVDLVTLSACQTAIGERNPDGGEISSLAQAFSAAGTPSVVASLWSVEDESTRRLMESFYKAFAAGNSKAQALQVAQKELLADPKSKHPFYWAPFELMGDWR